MKQQPVGGRVVSVTTTGEGNSLVTLEMIPINEMFTSLKIDQTYKLTNDDIEISDSIASFYSMEKNEDGSYKFTQKPNISTKSSYGNNGFSPPLLSGTPTGTVANPFHPLECNSTLPTIPLTLNVLPLSDNMTLDLNLIIQYDSDNEGLQKLALAGLLQTVLQLNPTLDIAFEGKIECTLELVTVTIPVGGPLALILGAQVPFGIGFEIGGKITLAQVGAEVKVESKVTAEIAFKNRMDREAGK